MYLEATNFHPIEQLEQFIQSVAKVKDEKASVRFQRIEKHQFVLVSKCS